MDKKLYFLNEEEKNRILNLHEERTKKQYLLLEMTKEERGKKFVDDYAVHCLQDITIDNASLDMKQINDISEKIYRLISGGGWIYATDISQDQLNQLVAIIKNLKTAGNYCAVDKRTTEIIRQKGTGTSWSSSGYENMHEIINTVIWRDTAWNQFVTAVSELKGWRGEKTDEKATETKSNRFWLNSNLTVNKNPSNEYNCVKYAFLENSSENWPSGKDLERVDKAFLKDPDTNEYNYYYYGDDLRYFSDGIWQDRTNKKITGEYYCGPGLYLEAVITGETSSSTTTTTTKKSGGSGGGGGGGGTITVNCNVLGRTKLTSQQISDLRKKIESTETTSSLSQNEINLIYKKIQ
jgi:hypothetical protein